jgi:ankyrin repeat protein
VCYNAVARTADRQSTRHLNCRCSAKEGNIEAVKQHLAAGADVNAKAESGWTPLHEAARSGRKEIAELLIDKGADVDAKIEAGLRPLDLAIMRNRTETADLLR